MTFSETSLPVDTRNSRHPIREISSGQIGDTPLRMGMDRRRGSTLRTPIWPPARPLLTILIFTDQGKRIALAIHWPNPGCFPAMVRCADSPSRLYGLSLDNGSRFSKIGISRCGDRIQELTKADPTDRSESGETEAAEHSNSSLYC